MRSVIVVEDNEVIAMAAGDVFSQMGAKVEYYLEAPLALKRIRSGPLPDCLFSDVVMPGSFDGFELAKQVRKLFPQVSILLTTGWPMPEYTGFDLLLKPYSTIDLVRWMRGI